MSHYFRNRAKYDATSKNAREEAIRSIRGTLYIVGIMVQYSDMWEETDSGQEEHVTHDNY